MKKWQKIWLYFLVIYSLFHLIRDGLQDFHIPTILSMILVKSDSSNLPSYWLIFNQYYNTYIVATTEVILALICLKRNYFGKFGYLTVIIALVAVAAWSYYWFFL